MRKRPTQYKRNPKLKLEFAEHLQAMGSYCRRLSAWEAVLRTSPSDYVVNRIANLLARLGFEPDEQGLPRGKKWPLITKTCPLVLLDAWGEAVRVHRSEQDIQDTLAWKADVLEAATLVWADIIELDEEQIQEVCPLATIMEVSSLLLCSDLEGFWNRPGVGKTAADIREMWNRGEVLITPKALADMLRRARRGGT